MNKIRALDPKTFPARYRAFKFSVLDRTYNLFVGQDTKVWSKALNKICFQDKKS